MQALTGLGRGPHHDAISAYHRALRTFTREAYPQEYSVLHNNLAIAYLSMPATDERGRMREALAVQSFEEVLKVISLIDHPSEYAMINNNLGNALQYASSSHVLENNLRALAAYDEALKGAQSARYAAGICQHHRQQGERVAQPRRSAGYDDGPVGRCARPGARGARPVSNSTATARRHR
jgi:tetratricopeptide (TPR) repeat protein